MGRVVDRYAASGRCLVPLVRRRSTAFSHEADSRPLARGAQALRRQPRRPWRALWGSFWGGDGAQGVSQGSRLLVGLQVVVAYDDSPLSPVLLGHAGDHEDPLDLSPRTVVPTRLLEQAAAQILGLTGKTGALHLLALLCRGGVFEHCRELAGAAGGEDRPEG